MKNPRMTMTIFKILDDHEETIYLVYDNLTTAVKVFCDKLKEHEHFAEIAISFELGDGLLAQMISRGNNIKIIGDQYRQYTGSIFSQLDSMYYNAIDVKDAPVEIAKLALYVAKERKRIEKVLDEGK